MLSSQVRETTVKRLSSCLRGREREGGCRASHGTGDPDGPFPEHLLGSLSVGTSVVRGGVSLCSTKVLVIIQLPRVGLGVFFFPL